ncbi:MAG: 1-deoxy-D-xylulose-5-phosphate synthase, partial [Colwellia sp.]
GKGVTIRKGDKIALLSFGTMLAQATITAEALNASLVDMRFVKPLDESLIEQLFISHDVLVTIEDNAIAGGAGSGVNEYLLAQGKAVRILNIGVANHFVKHGTQEEVHHELGLDAQGIIAKITSFIS